VAAVKLVSKLLVHRQSPTDGNLVAAVKLVSKLLVHRQSPTDGNLVAAVKLVSKLLPRLQKTSQPLYSATQNHGNPKC